MPHLMIFAIFLFYSARAAAADGECNGGVFEEVLVHSGEVSIKVDPSAIGDETNRTGPIEVDRFCMTASEVTVGDIQPCIEAKRCSVLRGDQNDISQPVHSMTYEEIVAFAVWLSESSGALYRLPSEAEWQRAAEFSSNMDGFGRSAWAATMEILGLGYDPVIVDMNGGVAEFVDDCFTRDIGRIPQDGSAFQDKPCSARITKGGHATSPSFMRDPYFRAWVPNDASSPQIGFRLVSLPDLQPR